MEVEGDQCRLPCWNHLPVGSSADVLSGRFNAWDDFWVVQVGKKPSQLVFIPSMAISQEDRMGIFVLNRLSFPTRKTCGPFGAEAGGDGVGSGPDYLAV